MDDDVAIRVDGVYKEFKLPHEKHSSIKGNLINIFRKKSSVERQKVLKNTSFEIKKGEFFGIVGRNGSGKSTLLKLLAGIYSPDKGHINLSGKLTPFIELGVGFNPELTGRENVFLNGALLGFDRKQMLKMYDDIVDFAEIEQFMDQKLKNYSSGMQVRLAFSIAIRAQSDILLIDEVLAVGDALFQKKCFEYFTKLRRERRTVVFVSHDTESLLRFCDRGVLINNGNVVSLGNIEDVVDEYKQILMQDDVRQAVVQGNHTSEVKRRVEILSYGTSNDKGPTKLFSYKEDIHIDIDFKIETEIESLNVAIGVYNGLYEDHADRVFGSSTQTEKINLGLNSSSTRLTISEPLLRNGNYIIYIVVFGDSEAVPYDYKWEAIKFEVTGAPKLQSRGVIVSKHEWTSK